MKHCNILVCVFFLVGDRYIHPHSYTLSISIFQLKWLTPDIEFQNCMWGDHYSIGELSLLNLGLYTVLQYILAPCKFIHKIHQFIFSSANVIKHFPLRWNTAKAVTSGGSQDEKFSAVRLWQTTAQLGNWALPITASSSAMSQANSAEGRTKNEMTAKMTDTLFNVSLYTHK